MNSLSLYIHIPFCAKKCRYCDFFSVPYESHLADRYLESLAKEIGLNRKNIGISDVTIETVFFGGGTPSVLSVEQIERLCMLVRSNFKLARDLEWTVECNPESFTLDKAEALRAAGVSRLTFGMQSLDDRVLSVLGRVHDAEQCRALLQETVLTRFQSIGVDLMYGLPGQSPGSLETSLCAVCESPYVNHVSAYELTIATATPFGRHRSILPLPDHDAGAAATILVWDILNEQGFEQYEVSNFARKGHRCRHNERYWDHLPYLGLGCAAHSYLAGHRFANVRDIGRYCDLLEKGSFPRENVECIDEKKAALEMLFMGLRRTDGISEQRFAEICGIPLFDFVNKEQWGVLVEKKLIQKKDDRWIPTREGLLLADAMVRELL